MREKGSAAVEIGIAVGMLLIPAALVVLGVGPWLERSNLARVAASEAARRAVVDLDVSAASALVAQVATNHGLDADEVTLSWCGSPEAAPALSTSACAFGRGTAVMAEVRVWVPLVNTPWGELGGVWVRGLHSEPIDLYRSLS